MDKDYQVGFRLKYGRDSQIIEWLESCGEMDKSYYIREALRYYLNAHMPQASSLLPPPPLSTSSAKSKLNAVDQTGFAHKAEQREKVDLKKNILDWFD